MSYIRARKVDVQESIGSTDGAIFLELPDHGMAGNEMEVDANLDDELLDAVLRIIGEIDELGEGEALVVWKVVF